MAGPHVTVTTDGPDTVHVYVTSDSVSDTTNVGDRSCAGDTSATTVGAGGGVVSNVQVTVVVQVAEAGPSALRDYVRSLREAIDTIVAVAR